MNTYKLFWLTEQTGEVTGNTPEQAMNNAGYGAGSLRALDFYALIEREDDWIWDAKNKSWDSKSLIEAYGSK